MVRLTLGFEIDMKAWFLEWIGTVVIKELDPWTNEIPRLVMNTQTKLGNLFLPFPLAIVLVGSNIILFNVV